MLKKTCISIYLEKENYAKIKKLAKKNEMTISRFLATTLVKLFKKEK